MIQNGLKRLEEIASRLDSAGVGRFLVRNGFTPKSEDDGTSILYVGKQGELIIVPTNRHLRDYARRVREIIEMFATGWFTIEDVIALMVLPEADILRYRIETPDTVWGNLPLSYGYEAIHALHDTLKYSAAGVSSGKRDYRQVSDEAQAYAKLCRFGQTELGSFVLKIYCPTKPIARRDPSMESFGRLSTKSTIENFEFIASERAQNPSQPLPPTLNRQVASAVHRLKPGSDFGTSIVSVQYLPTSDSDLERPVLPPQQEIEDVTLDLGPFIYNRAQSIRDRLKKAEEFGRETVIGYITDLHKDRPTITEQSRQISLEVKYGASFRKVTMRLLPGDYRKAVLWHDTEEKVRLDAVFDKRGKPWSVNELFEFVPLDKNAPDVGLFSPPDPPQGPRTRELPEGG